MRNPTPTTVRAFSLIAPDHQPMSGALRRTMHLDRTTVFGLWDAMSPRKNFSNKIVEAEANPASSRRVKAPPLDGMEWTTMNEDDADESLLVLIGELLYKNQLLREAIASKDEVIELIINHLMIAATSACSCGVANQLTFVRNTVKERDVEVSAPQKVLLQRILQCCEVPIDNAANSRRNVAIRAAENWRLTPMISMVSEERCTS